MATIDDLARISGNSGAVTTSPMLPAEGMRTYTQQAAQQLGAPRAPLQLGAPSSVPAIQAPMYTPESAPRLGAPRAPVQLNAPTSAPQLGAPSAGVPAEGIRNYTPESAPRLGAAPIAAAEAPAIGPLARAASFAKPLMRGLGAIGAVAGAYQAGDAIGNVINNHLSDGAKDAIGSTVNQGVRGIGGLIGQDWGVDDSALKTQQAQPSTGAQAPATGVIPSAATLPQRGGASGSWNAAAAQTAPTAPTIPDNGGGNTPTYQADMQRLQTQANAAPATDPTATATAAPQSAPSNPFNEPVQVIRPGGQVTMAVQGNGMMHEMDEGTFNAYKNALDKNPALLNRMQITAGGPTIDGVAIPGNVLASGDQAVNSYLSANHQNSINQADPLAAHARAKIAETMGDPGVMNSANPAVATNAQIPSIGDDFVNTLPPARAALIKSIVNGGMQVSPFLIAKNPGLMTQVAQADPSFDVKDVNARSKLQSSFKAGPDAENIKSLNTAMAHINHLDSHLTAMNNGDYPALNTATNWLGNQFGNKNIQGNTAAVETDAKGVAGEMAKVFRSSGMSEHEISDWKQSFSTATTPSAQHATIEAAMGLLKGRMDAIGDKYTKGMGTAATPYPILSKENQAAFDRLSGNAPSAAAAQAAPPQAAAAHLQAHPELRAQFEAKYGKGSSASILGK